MDYTVPAVAIAEEKGLSGAKDHKAARAVTDSELDLQGTLDRKETRAEMDSIPERGHTASTPAETERPAAVKRKQEVSTLAGGQRMTAEDLRGPVAAREQAAVLRLDQKRILVPNRMEVDRRSKEAKPKLVMGPSAERKPVGPRSAAMAEPLRATRQNLRGPAVEKRTARRTREMDRTGLVAVAEGAAALRTWPYTG